MHKENSGSGCAKLDEIAYELERLVTEVETRSSRLVFLKTFAKSALSEGIYNEIASCMSGQPRQDNICGVSRASFGALVETGIDNIGWVGLVARLPFVAYDYCEGSDLFDVYWCFSLQLSGMLWTKLCRLLLSQDNFTDSFTKVKNHKMNRLLLAASKFQHDTFDHMCVAQRALDEVSRTSFVDKLASYAIQWLSMHESRGPSGEEMIRRSPWADIGWLHMPGSTSVLNFVRFKTSDMLKDHLNKLVKAISESNMEEIGRLLNQSKWGFNASDPPDQALITARLESKKEDIDRLAKMNLDTLSADDPRRWLPILHTFWPEIRFLHASAALRHIFSLVLEFKWDEIVKILRHLQIGNFSKESLDLGVTDVEAALKAIKKSLMDVACKQHAAAHTFHEIVDSELSTDDICRGRLSGSNRSEVTSLLLAHCLCGRGARLRGMTLHAHEQNQNITTLVLGATRAIFMQTAKAVEQLHRGDNEERDGYAHGDIKLENFILTVHGQVKLLDFGFMIDLNTDPPKKILRPHYCSEVLKWLGERYDSFTTHTSWELSLSDVEQVMTYKGKRLQNESGKAAVSRLLAAIKSAKAQGKSGVSMKNLLKVLRFVLCMLFRFYFLVNLKNLFRNYFTCQSEESYLSGE